MKLFYSPEIVQKEVTRRHEGNVAKLPIVFCVVSNYHVAPTSNSTLVLQHILVVFYFPFQPLIELAGIHRKDLRVGGKIKAAMEAKKQVDK